MFKKGDVVTVRQWDDMAAEYGVVKWDGTAEDLEYIDIPALAFIRGMENYCGKTYVIEDVRDFEWNGETIDEIRLKGIYDVGFSPVMFEESKGGPKFSTNEWLELMG